MDRRANFVVRIIKDFYLDFPAVQRPRVFGMTASPVDSKMNIVRGARYVILHWNYLSKCL